MKRLLIIKNDIHNSSPPQTGHKLALINCSIC